MEVRNTRTLGLFLKWFSTPTQIAEKPKLKRVTNVDIAKLLKALEAAETVNYGTYNNPNSFYIVLGLMPFDCSYASFWISDMSTFKNVYNA